MNLLRSFAASSVGRRAPAPGYGLLALFLALAAVLAPRAHSSQAAPPLKLTQYAHTAWRIQDGIFEGTPNAIAQTADGYLWIGTETGLVRFDGLRFVPWTDPKLKVQPSFSVYALQGSADGSLWVGTDRGLAKLRDGVLTFLPGAPGRVNAIVEDNRGTIWMARSRVFDGNGPLCEVAGDALRCHGKREGIACPYGNALVRDNTGVLWIAGVNQVCNWKNGAGATYSPAGLKAGQDLTGLSALAPQSDSLLLGFVRSGNQLGLQRLVSGAFTQVAFPALDNATLKVASMYADRAGTLWIGTMTQGIYRVANGAVDHYSSQDGLSGNQIQNVFEDREGSFWVVTSGGIDRFHEATVVPFSTREGMIADDFPDVLGARDGTLWSGGLQGLNAYRNGEASSLQPKDGLPGQQVTTLFEDHAGALWLGVDDHLVRYSNGHFSPVPAADGSQLGIIRSIAEDAANVVWAVVGNRPARIFRVGNGHFAEEVKMPEAMDATQIVSSPRGAIWAALRSGALTHYDGNEFVSVKGPGPVILGLSIRADDSILAFSSNGLYEQQAGTWAALTIRNGLPCDGVESMVADLEGTLWLHLRCGIAAIGASELAQWHSHPNDTVKVRLFDVFDGGRAVTTTFLPRATRTRDGRLWFANLNGPLQMLDPTHLQWNNLPPPVHMEQVVADQKTFPLQKTITLPALTRDLEIDYTGLSFIAPQKMRFRYALWGLDKTWQDVGTRRQAFYMNLKPGKYTFQAIASNNDGVWNTTGDTINLIIPPKFYQTLWFELLMIVLVAGMLWTLVLIRIRQTAERVEARMTERLSERDRIARELHDTFLQGVQSLILRFQVATDAIPPTEPARSMLESTLERADKVLNEGRERVRDLRSENDKDEDLEKCLQALSEELGQGRSALCRVTSEGKCRPLHPVVREEFEAIAREAMYNAFLHSQATEIVCEVEYGKRYFRFVCRDNGVGIDPQILSLGGRSGHWGLKGMRERAKKIGATLQMQSGPNGGTRLELKLRARVAFAPGLRWSPWRLLRQKLGLE